GRCRRRHARHRRRQSFGFVVRPLVPTVHALVLGVTQGLSEFLPISSSGHLILVPWLFRWHELTNDPGLNRTFDVALHAGTFVGAAAYFWSDLVRLVRAGARSLAARRFVDDDGHR